MGHIIFSFFLPQSVDPADSSDASRSPSRTMHLTAENAEDPSRVSAATECSSQQRNVDTCRAEQAEKSESESLTPESWERSQKSWVSSQSNLAGFMILTSMILTPSSRSSRAAPGSPQRGCSRLAAQEAAPKRWTAKRWRGGRCLWLRPRSGLFFAYHSAVHDSAESLRSSFGARFKDETACSAMLPESQIMQLRSKGSSGRTAPAAPFIPHLGRKPATEATWAA